MRRGPQGYLSIKVVVLLARRHPILLGVKVIDRIWLHYSGDTRLLGIGGKER
ncbi:hypothetical protein chiPu_0026896, partial [Chiloscyllium punctatum]|nr:hypothetical protein [Chiloscyllium punctatum]